MIEVGDEVVGILQAHMQAQHGAARLGIRQGPRRAQIDGYHQAFEAAPGIAEAEDAEGVEEGMGLRLVAIRRAAVPPALPSTNTPT